MTPLPLIQKRGTGKRAQSGAAVNRKRHPNPRLAKIHRSYTVEEVASLYGVHRNTVQNWVNTGVNARLVVIDKPNSNSVGIESRASSTVAAYESRIDALWNGAAPKFHGVRVLDRSDVLDLLGFGDKPVFLQESKVVKGKANHNLTAEHWKKVPEWLENPSAVFDSDTVAGRLVFLAPEQLNGDPIVMVVEPAADKSGLTVNLLVNAYDKDSGRMPLRRWIDDGLLRYYDKRISPAILARSGLQLPSLAQARGRDWKIRRDADLVKYRQRMSEAGSQSAESRLNRIGAGTRPEVITQAHIIVTKFLAEFKRAAELDIRVVASVDNIPSRYRPS